MLENDPEPHARALLAELRTLRAELLAIRPQARFLAFWDLDGTLLHGDCSEGLVEQGREIYPGLVRLAVERGYSSDYAEEHGGYAACRDDYDELAERVGGLLAYPFLVQILAGAEERALAELAERHFETKLRSFYFAASREILEGLAVDGVEQHVLSASAEVFVRGAAASLGLPPERMHGIRVRTEDGRLTRDVLHPVTHAEGKAAKLREVVRAAEAAMPDRPVFVLAAFGNSFDSDGAFMAHVVDRPLPAGRPLAVMINAGFAPGVCSRMFRSVRQTRVVGEN